MMKNNKPNAADYLNFDLAKETGLKLIDSGDNFGLFILFGIYTGLRLSDLLLLNTGMIEEAKVNNNILRIIEHKTRNTKKKNKIREIKLNPILIDSYNKLSLFGLLFAKHDGNNYSKMQINRRLKKYFQNELTARNVSAHSLRKTFGRRVYDLNNQSEYALVKLSQMFGHSSIALTRIYLGITKDEINNIYISL